MRVFLYIPTVYTYNNLYNYIKYKLYAKYAVYIHIYLTFITLLEFVVFILHFVVNTDFLHILLYIQKKWHLFGIYRNDKFTVR